MKSPRRGIPGDPPDVLPGCGVIIAIAHRLSPFAGGLEEFFRLGYEDAVLELFDPMTTQALGEFPATLAALREQLPAGDDAVGLIGASTGAFVALRVLAETDIPVSAVALITPAIRLASVVAANERRFGVTYPWSEGSRQVAQRLDFVACADASSTTRASAGRPSNYERHWPVARPAALRWCAFPRWGMHSPTSRASTPRRRHRRRRASRPSSSIGSNVT